LLYRNIIFNALHDWIEILQISNFKLFTIQANLNLP
jgi:hypothetical protein